MTRSKFSLFQSHLDLAHHYWSHIVHIGDSVIDATCGKGFDTLKLCQLSLSVDKGKVYGFDIQAEAIETTKHYLQANLSPEIYRNIFLKKHCHSTFPEEISPESIKLIVYNLGYLPGGDKQKTTESETTLQSLQKGEHLIIPGGVISMTFYPGHEEGANEKSRILSYISKLSPKEWSCCHHQWVNRKDSPSLLILQKRIEANSCLIT